MKKIILLLLIILELFIVKIPDYVELNNLAIIEEIGIIQENNQYTIILKEVIPIKDNQGITYKYSYYEQTSTSLSNAYKNIENSTKKKLYLKRTKSLITNQSSSKEVLELLKIKPQTITHTSNDIREEIKSN